MGRRKLNKLCRIPPSWSNFPLLKYGLCIVTSFQRLQHGKRVTLQCRNLTNITSAKRSTLTSVICWNLWNYHQQDKPKEKWLLNVMWYPVYDLGTDTGPQIKTKEIYTKYALQLIIYQYWFLNCNKCTMLIY